MNNIKGENKTYIFNPMILPKETLKELLVYTYNLGVQKG